MDEARTKQIYRVKPGQTYWFEYHCEESHTSCDAKVWYHSHQQAKVLRMTQTGFGENEEERAENGQVAHYQIVFNDGFDTEAGEDELMDSRESFYRPDPPAPVKEGEEEDEEDEEDEMSPAALADFAMAAAGPSMYATKTEHNPPGNHGEYYVTRWDLAIPVSGEGGKKLSVIFVETANPKPGGSMFIYTNISLPGRLLASEALLISDRYDDKAKVYRVMYDFVSELRNLCKAGLPLHMLIYQVSKLLNSYSQRNKEGKLIPEAAELSPADLARRSIEIIGPSVYAKKIESYPESNMQHRSVTWLVEIPLSNPQLLPGQKVNLFIREFSHSKGELVIFITARSLSPENRGRSYEHSIIVREARLITVPWANRAEAYRILHEYVNDIREICQGPKYAYIMQEIANLTNSIQGYAPGREPKEESAEQSSLEIAAVLLEMDPAELAKTSVNKVVRMSQPFYVLVEDGKFHVEEDGKVINYFPDREFTDLTAYEMDQERNRLQVVKFNVVEWIGHYHTNKAQDVNFLDMGCWFKDGTYTAPDADWREMSARYAGRGMEPQHEAMTPKDLAIQSVGLPTFAHLVHSVAGEDTRTYGWKSTANGYTLKIYFSEFRRGDRLILKFNPWVETKPTIYDGPDGFTIYDGDWSGKGDIYARIWRALHDLKEAHDAGIDKEDLLDLAVQVFHKEGMLSDKQQEEKGRPVI